MIVIIDSNILIADFYLKKTNSQLLRRFGQVVLPEIVYDEVQNKHRERIEEAYLTLTKKLDEYNLYASSPVQIIDCSDIDNEMMQYESFLTSFMIEMGSYPPESYPNVSHKDIVRRALYRRKPFKADGKDGYRDYLLWLTILEVMKTHKSEEVHFISENTSDFADPQDRYKLHEHLVDDIKLLGEDENRLIFWPSLKDFVDKVVKPHLQKVEKKEELISRLTNDKDGFMHQIELFLKRELHNFNVQDFEVFVPGSNPIIDEFAMTEAFNIEEISEAGESEMLIEGSAYYYSIVKSSDSYADIASLPMDVLADSRVEVNENGVADIYTEVTLKVDLQIMYDKISNSIETIEIAYVSDSSYCEYCPYE